MQRRIESYALLGELGQSLTKETFTRRGKHSLRQVPADVRPKPRAARAGLPCIIQVQLRKDLGEVFRRLATQKECRIEEGHLLPDHVHMMIARPPKYAVSEVVGYIKGKSAIHLARVYGERKRNFTGQHFWARGYFVSTVGRDEAAIREYIRNQEKEDQRLDQLKLELWPATVEVANTPGPR